MPFSLSFLKSYKRMKRPLLDRYDQTGDGHIVIDVAATRVQDLYNNFDKNAPYIRRDLDPDLVDYLIGCANELKREDYIVRFSLEHSPDDGKQSRIRRSINAYFLYLAEDEKRQILQMFRHSTILFCIGLAILFLSVSVNQVVGMERSVVANVFAEGLTIAAWVSLWESLAVFLLEWFPHRKKIILYRRLAAAEVVFREEP